MGALLTVKGADFSASAIAFVPPVVEGLEYWNYFGDGAKSGRNLVLGKPSATVVGAPVASGTFLSTSAGNFVETGLLDQSEVTIITAGRGPNLVNASTWGMLVASYAGADNPGSALTFLQSSQVLLGVLAGRSNGSGGVTQTQTNSTGNSDKAAWGFMEARIGATRQSVRDWTRNVGGQTTPASARVPNGRPYRIGSNTGAAQGALDFAFVAIYSRVLSDAEMDTIYQRVKAYLSGKNITI